MKLSLLKPQRNAVLQDLATMSSERLNYLRVGSSLTWDITNFADLPNYKVVDGDLLQFRKFPIGEGLADFQAAVEMIRQGASLKLDWVECIQSRDFEDGDVFCLASRAFGVWTANYCRIVYLREQSVDSGRLFSMGIGTLRTHAAAGEERMSVHMESESGKVSYLIGSFSRPYGLLSKIFVGYLRRQQNRFAVDSANAVRSSLRLSSQHDRQVQKNQAAITVQV